MGVLGINNQIFMTLIFCGTFLMLTAALGCVAAQTKNEALAFMVSINSIIMG